MINQKNPELINEESSPELGSGNTCINFPSSRTIMVETGSKVSELL